MTAPMRFWRDVANDRLSGGVLGALLALAFALQLAVAGHAAAAIPGPADVICTASFDGSHRPSETDRRGECPCASLCCAGAPFPASIAPSDETGRPVRFADRVEIAADRAAPVPAGPVVERPPARGPPATSIRR